MPYVIIPLIGLVSVLLFATGVAGLAGAIGVVKRRSWARYLLLCLGAVWLIKVPVGTALGAYTFYVLTREGIVSQFQ